MIRGHKFTILGTTKDHNNLTRTKSLFVYNFLKLFCVLKKKKKTMSTHRTSLVLNRFFFVLKNTKSTENTKFREQEQFLDITKIVLS